MPLVKFKQPLYGRKQLHKILLLCQWLLDWQYCVIVDKASAMSTLHEISDGTSSSEISVVIACPRLRYVSKFSQLIPNISWAELIYIFIQLHARIFHTSHACIHSVLRMLQMSLINVKSHRNVVSTLAWWIFYSVLNKSCVLHI